MDFAGHAKGGAVAGLATVTLAAATGHLAAGPDTLADLLAAPLGPGPVRTAVGLYATTWFMALFPDLDVTSVPQRWFLRAMFALLVLTWLAGRGELFAVLAFAALLPLLHRHRGWTHWPLAPWAVSLFLAVVHEHLRAEASWFFGFSWANVWDFLQGYWLYVIAAVLGHYTHLLLDATRVRGLPFIRNEPGHH